MSDERFSHLAPLLAEIRRHADALDQSGDWPADDLRQLAEAGALKMAIPALSGGLGASALEQHLFYETVARASLSVALILSQRDAAIGLIEASATSLRHTLLLKLAAGTLATVGIAQLTTSHQGSAPALQAIRKRGGYQVDGMIPWCTGAAKAGIIVAGAAMDDGQQILFWLPTDPSGPTINPPMPLVALRSTWTTSLQCDGVFVANFQLIQGPAQKVLVRNNHLPLGQAFLAMGLCRGALDLLHEHHSTAAHSATGRFETQLGVLRARIIELCQPGREVDAATAGA